MRRLLVAFALLIAATCTSALDIKDQCSIKCPDKLCPSGFTCRGGFCQQGSADICKDKASGAMDAAPSGSDGPAPMSDRTPVAMDGPPAVMPDGPPATPDTAKPTPDAAPPSPDQAPAGTMCGTMVCGQGMLCCRSPMPCANSCVPDCRLGTACMTGLMCNQADGFCQPIGMGMGGMGGGPGGMAGMGGGMGGMGGTGGAGGSNCTKAGMGNTITCGGKACMANQACCPSPLGCANMCVPDCRVAPCPDTNLSCDQCDGICKPKM